MLGVWMFFAPALTEELVNTGGDGHGIEKKATDQRDRYL